MTLDEVLRRMLPNGAVQVTSPYYRDGTGGYVAGSVHGGVDFIYADPALNAANGGHPDVFAPVTGKLLALSPLEGGYGSVFIEDADGFVHSIVHLDTRNDSLLTQLVGKTITEGPLLGTMGNRVPPGEKVPGIHVHYAVYLPGFDRSNLDGSNRIDPAIYWTPGLNPYAGELSGTSFDTQKLNRTGLLVTSTAIRDVNNDGAADSQGYLKEGEQAFLSFEINTPHTQAVVLRIRFSGQSLKAGQLLFDTSNPNVRVDSVDPNTVYLTLPPTQSQSAPNTSALLGLTFDGFEDLDFASAVLHYTVETGYPDTEPNVREAA